MGRRRARSLSGHTLSRRSPIFCGGAPAQRLDRSFERHTIGQEKFRVTTSGRRPATIITGNFNPEPQAQRRQGAARAVRVSNAGLHRGRPSPIHDAPGPATDEHRGKPRLRAWRKFSTDRPRWGWRAAKMARRAGLDGQQHAHPTAVARGGPAGPQRRRKKRLTGIGVVVGAMSPIRPNLIGRWTSSSTPPPMAAPLKMLNVIDEFTREALAIEVDRAIDADGVAAAFGSLIPAARRPGLRALRQRP